jgi:hypothetical protein
MLIGDLLGPRAPCPDGFVSGFDLHVLDANRSLKGHAHFSSQRRVHSTISSAREGLYCGILKQQQPRRVEALTGRVQDCRAAGHYLAQKTA